MLHKSLNQFYQYALLMRLHRPIGILLLLWPTLWALWIAGNGKPSFAIVIIFVSGVIIMRSAGCVINDFADRHFDGFVARTKDRPLVNGKITPKKALILFVILTMIAFLLVLFLNPLTILLSLVGVALAVIYPFMKRYIHSPQFVFGLAFSWGVPMAFAAQTNSVPSIAWLIFITNAFWCVIYDTMYAMVDKPDDLRIGIKSTAILFGNADRLIIGILQTTMITLLFLLGKILSLSIWFYAGLLITILFFIYQQYLIKDREQQKCFQAFLNNQWVGLVIFLGLVISYYLR